MVIGFGMIAYVMSRRQFTRIHMEHLVNWGGPLMYRVVLWSRIGEGPNYVSIWLFAPNYTPVTPPPSAILESYFGIEGEYLLNVGNRYSIELRQQSVAIITYSIEIARLEVMLNYYYNAINLVFALAPISLMF